MSGKLEVLLSRLVPGWLYVTNSETSLLTCIHPRPSPPFPPPPKPFLEDSEASVTWMETEGQSYFLQENSCVGLVLNFG